MRVVSERLRWWLVLPAAVVTSTAVLLPTVLFYAIVSLGLTFVQLVAGSRAGEVASIRSAFVILAPWSLAPAAFLLGGALMAPKERIRVGIWLGVLATAFIALFSFYQMNATAKPQSLYVLAYLVSTLGSVCAVGILYLFRDKKLNYKIVLGFVLFFVGAAVGLFVILIVGLSLLNRFFSALV